MLYILSNFILSRFDFCEFLFSFGNFGAPYNEILNAHTHMHCEISLNSKMLRLVAENQEKNAKDKPNRAVWNWWRNTLDADFKFFWVIKKKCSTERFYYYVFCIFFDIFRVLTVFFADFSTYMDPVHIHLFIYFFLMDFRFFCHKKQSNFVRVKQCLS